MSMELEHKVRRYQRSRRGIFKISPTLVGENPLTGKDTVDFGMGGDINQDYRRKAICPRLVIADRGLVPLAVCRDGQRLEINKGGVSCPASCTYREDGVVDGAGFLVDKNSNKSSSR